MAAAAPVPALLEELVEEILLRLPPAEPDSLVRAALFHRAPPMLNLICNCVNENFYNIYLARFVPTYSFRPPHANRREWRALDARHGRVLLRGHCLPTTGTRLCSAWPVALAAPVTTSTATVDTHDIAGLLVRGWNLERADLPKRILKYDLATREINVHLQPPGSYRTCTTIMTVEDGGLGAWDGHKSVIDLPKLLSIDANSICSDFLGFAHGVGVIFVGTGDGLFSFDLKSGQVRNVCEAACYFNGIRGVVPFISFHTP
uniref:F-box domain-containing protein n=1 Tax=Setaria italica TaxID=4555 RepID=K3Z0Z5_SETIT